MEKLAKRMFSAFLTLTIILSVITITPMTASAADNTITLAELQKQQPSLFTKFEYVPGYPIFGLTSEYTIPKNTTLVISNKETPLQISNIDNSKFGSLIVGEGATLLIEPEGAISINSPEGIKIEKGGVMKFADDATRKFARTTYLNDIINNGTIIVGEKRQIAQNGRFSGNRPVGSFHLYDMSWQYSERGALEYFEDFAPEKHSDKDYFVPDVFPSVGYSGYSGVPIYWSVKETTKGYVYTAELIPLYKYDGFWVFKKGGNEIDYSKPIQIKGGVLKFGAGSEFTVVTCTYNEVKERIPEIEKLIKSQGKRPVAGSVTAPAAAQTANAAKLNYVEVVSPKYDDANQYSEGMAAVKLNGKWGYIDVTGKEVIAFKYDIAASFYDGMAKVKLNGKCGYIDKSGKDVIPLQYDNAYSFVDGLAPVKLNGKWGYIDKSGKEVIPFKYDDANNFSDGVSFVKLNGQGGFINKIGKEVVPFKYDDTRYFSEGIAAVKLNGKWGYVDKTGKEIVSPKYKMGLSFSDGLALICTDTTVGYIDKTGKEILLSRYDDAWGFYEGIAAVRTGGKWGYIDKSGKEIVPCKYDNGINGVYYDDFRFSEGMAAVNLNGKWGYIDKTGKEIIPFKYSEALHFLNGVAVVRVEAPGSKWGVLWGVIDKTGKEIVPFKYDTISDGVANYSDGLMKVSLNDKYGFIYVGDSVPTP